MSSWWAAIHGYRHPVLDEAARGQLGRMSHVMFGGLTHEPAIRLCDRLARSPRPGCEHVFLCDSGLGLGRGRDQDVPAVLAVGWAAGQARLLTWRGGYHGDTFMAMSVCDPDGGMHRLWDGVLPPQVFAGRPPAGFRRRGRSRLRGEPGAS